MTTNKRNPGKTPERRLLFENGKIYFGKDTERKFFFALTVIMLACGILYKLGWL